MQSDDGEILRNRFASFPVSLGLYSGRYALKVGQSFYSRGELQCSVCYYLRLI